MIEEVFGAVDKICILLEKAGYSILNKFKKGDFDVSWKEDGSSLTQADLQSNTLIVDSLLKLFARIPIISEENIYENNVKASKSNVFWLLDPLDGTTNFINGEEFFTINLALVQNNIPVLGFIYLPCHKVCYYGFGNQVFKWTEGMSRVIPQKLNSDIKLLIMSKRANLNSIKKIRSALAPDASIEIHSSAQKFCFLAEGKADLYPCCNDVYEWDVAAGHAIVSAIGGTLLPLNGKVFKYGNAANNFATDHFLAVRSLKMLDQNKIKTIVDLCL